MKKILLIGLLGLSSFAHADYCMSIKEFSSALMDARQRGVTEKRVHEILIQNKPRNYEDYRVLDSLIDWAYSIPVMGSSTKKKVVVYDFADRAYKTCQQFEGED